MDDSQALQSLIGSSGSGATSSQLGNLQSLLTVGLVVSTIITVAFCIYIVVSYIHKWKVQSAILRIDKNLQKLVELQTGKPADAVVETIEAPAVAPIEEKHDDLGDTPDDVSSENSIEQK